MTEDIKPQLPAVGGRPQAIIPQDIESAYRLAQFVSASGLAPAGMKTPEQCMVAILTGAEVGLPPMAAIQRIAVIGGRACIWGDALLALVLSSPLCENFDEYFEGDGETRTAVCIIKRKGREKPIKRQFSVADAKTAALWGKSGPWQQYPDRMQQMRARGFASRDALPELFTGLYIREELEDDRPETMRGAIPYAPPLDEPPPLEKIENDEGAACLPNGIKPRVILTAQNDAYDNLKACDELVLQEISPKPKRHRATKSEMEIRRAAEAHRAHDVTHAIAATNRQENAMNPGEVALAACVVKPEQDDPPFDMPPVPSPIDEPIIAASIDTYRACVAAARNSDDLDLAWSEHVYKIQDHIPREVYEELAALDDRRRGEIETL